MEHMEVDQEDELEILRGRLRAAQEEIKRLRRLLRRALKKNGTLYSPGRERIGHGIYE